MKNKIVLLFIKTYLFIFVLTLIIPYSVFADDIEYEENDDQSIQTSIEVQKDPKLNARSCIVYDRTSKQILYGKNEYNKVKMASTTKIMTAVVVIENYDLNKTIEVSKKAASTGGSRLGLKTGDTITVNDLLYGLMLCSGNDAAVALSETVSGSVKDFAELMNKKALELGLYNSHFESPHGLDSDNHYTTAYELAKLSDYALNNKTFSKIVGTKNYTITINGYPKALSNTNELLGSLNGVYGIKTGFTNGANRCLVTACKRNDMDIITVVLGCDTKKFRTQDSIKLIEYAFNNFTYINIEDLINKEFDNWKKENLNYFAIDKGIHSNLEISISKLEYPIIPIKNENQKNLTFDVNVLSSLPAPVNKNDVIGNISVYSNSLKLIAANIIVNNSIQKKKLSDYLLFFFKDYSKLLNSIKSI